MTIIIHYQEPQSAIIDEGYKKGYKKVSFLIHLFEACDFV